MTKNFLTKKLMDVYFMEGGFNDQVQKAQHVAA